VAQTGSQKSQKEEECGPNSLPEEPRRRRNVAQLASWEPRREARYPGIPT